MNIQHNIGVNTKTLWRTTSGEVRATQDAKAEGQGERVKHVKSLARALRRQATDAEHLLWKHLRGRRLAGHKFRRQVVIEAYIVDFVCLEAKLIIEADGGQHAEQAAYDARRTARLEYRVMRFWNQEILKELHSVLEQIQSALIETPSPQPSALASCVALPRASMHSSPGGRGS